MTADDRRRALNVRVALANIGQLVWVHPYCRGAVNQASVVRIEDAGPTALLTSHPGFSADQRLWGWDDVFEVEPFDGSIEDALAMYEVTR